MTNTLTDNEARKKALKEARVLRERANRVGTNLKPHLRELINREAAILYVSPRSMLRILICEALEARGNNLTFALKDWKERNPTEDDSEDDGDE